MTSDKGEKARSQTAWFETAKNDRNWEAEWITPDFGSEIREDGVLCRGFVIEKKVKKARLSITGVGLYEVYIDGRNEDFPGWLYAVNMGATTVWERWDSIRLHPHLEYFDSLDCTLPAGEKNIRILWDGKEVKHWPSFS